MLTLLSLVLGALYTEFIGYFLHKLLHSERVPWLSRSHMMHHLKDYGPKMPMRTSAYQVAQTTSVGNIGLEWLGPIALILAFTFGLAFVLGINMWYTLLFSCAAIGWGITTFNYMHDRLHLEGYWMLNTWLGRWFKKIRRLHDIHHIKLTDDGRMDCNFGICFFWLDKLFGTYRKKGSSFNEKGMMAAKERYAFIYDAESHESLPERFIETIGTQPSIKTEPPVKP